MRSRCGNAASSETWRAKAVGDGSGRRGDSPHPRTSSGASPRGRVLDLHGRRAAVEVLADEQLERAEVAFGEVLEMSAARALSRWLMRSCSPRPDARHVLDQGEDHVVEAALERLQEVFGGNEVEVCHGRSTTTGVDAWRRSEPAPPTLRASPRLGWS